MSHNHVNSIQLPQSQIVAAVFECFKSEAETVCRFLKHYQFFVVELLLPQNVMDTAVANPRILTPSEIDVLQRLADGQPIKEIAGGRRRRNKVYRCLHRLIRSERYK